jgi:phosphomethylpyrimidine synthase
MKITEDVRKYAAEQGLDKEAAVATGMAEKAEEFTTTCAHIYRQA